jgi:hypothetical protein
MQDEHIMDTSGTGRSTKPNNPNLFCVTALSTGYQGDCLESGKLTNRPGFLFTGFSISVKQNRF